MNLMKKISVATLLTVISLGANANFIKGDWLSIGDNLSVVDTDTGIEWLSVDQTNGKSIATVQDQLSTTYLGWRLPTRAEVGEMMGNMYLFTDSSGASEKLTAQDSSVFSEAMGFSSATAFSSAFHLNDEISTFVGSSQILMSGFSGTDITRNSNTSGIVHMNFAHAEIGVYLVSDGGVTISSISDPSINIVPTVPEPLTLGLFGLALAGMSVRRQEK